MPLVSSSIPNLLNGVSQQPDNLRLPSQCSLQDNLYPSVVEGLIRRHPTEFVAKISNSPLYSNQAFVHWINRDPTNRYAVVITAGGNIAVYDQAGTSRTVHTPNGVAYITDATPQTTFRAITVADYTFILNTSVLPAQLNSAVGPSPAATSFDLLITVKQGDYLSDYSVTLTVSTSGFVQTTYSVTYTTGSTSSDPTGSTVKTTNIATQLASLLAGTALGSTWTFSTLGNTIYGKCNNSSVSFPVSLVCTDSIGGFGLTGVVGHHTINHFSDLPRIGHDGFMCQVANDQTTNYGTYYTIFRATNTSQTTEGSWVETCGPQMLTSFDASTMPMVLIANNDGTFTLQQATWNTCQAGDNITNPFPFLRNKPIQNLMFHKNRLMFLQDEQVVASQAGQFFNFWRTTVTAFLDSDPFVITCSNQSVDILRHGVAFQGDALLFSDGSQFDLSSGSQAFGAKTVSATKLTSHRCSWYCPPVGSRRNVFFTHDRGSFASLREYTSVALKDTYEADDVIAHTPTYVPAGVVAMAYCDPESCLFMFTPNSPNILYGYKFFEQQGNNIQSSVWRWVFDQHDQILGITCWDEYLWMAVSSEDGIYLYKMCLQAGYVDNTGTLMHLDRKATLTGTVTTVLGVSTTTFTTPWYIPAGATVQVVSTVSGPNLAIGFQPQVISASGYTVTVQGSISQAYVGITYPSRYRFSKIVVRERSITHGEYIPETGRLQLKSLVVVFQNSGYFRVEVTPQYGAISPYEMTAQLYDEGSDVTDGPIILRSGRFYVPLQMRNDQVQIDLVADSALPANFVSADWEGQYTIRSQRLP